MDLTNAKTHENVVDIPVETFFLFVDSRNRDSTIHVSQAQYVVDFDNVFKNIISVELVHAIYGRLSGNDMYVNLHIEELNPNIVSTTNSCKGAFTQLTFFSPTNDKYEYSQNTYRSIRRFDKPLMKLSKLSITFTKDDGTFFPIAEHLLRFEIVCFKQNERVEDWGDFKIMTQSLKVYQPKVIKDPYTVLGVNNGLNDMNILITAFKKKSVQLRNDGYNQSVYDELKDAFATIAKTLKQR
jgi:hypothetical protein